MPKSTKRFTLSNDGLNSQGFRMLTEGADLGAFKKNPLLLWNHLRPKGNDRNQILPLGYWDDLEVKNGEISGVPVFDDDDEFAMQIYRKVENGTLRMCSVGAVPLETSSDPSILLPLQLKETVTKWVMKEGSICDIGSNPNALAVALYDNEDNIITLSESNIANINPIDMADKTPKTPKTPEVKLNEKELADLRAERDDLKEKLETLEAKAAEDKVLALVDGAIEAKKINAAQKDHFKKLALADYESAKTVLDGIEPAVTLSDRLKNVGNSDTHIEKKVRQLSEMTGKELFAKGGFKFLAEHAPDVYKLKYEEAFGCAPKDL